MPIPPKRAGRQRPRAASDPQAEAAIATAEVPPAEPPPEPLPLNGNLDTVRPDGTLIAWCWSPAEPALRREVSVWIDDAEVARASCDQPRADLLGAGVGDGAHGLTLLLPESIARPGHSVTVMLRDVATGRQIGATVPVTWHVPAAAPAPAPEPPPEPPPRTLRGNLDRVSRDGWVSGWCWYPGYPGEHIDLSILVDDEAVGTTQATTYRADLKDAGVGEGDHGFSFALPWSAMAEKGMLSITVRETASWTVLGDPILMRAGRVAMAEERIQDLERQLRLLRGQIEEIGRQNQARDEDQAARALFATVAGFFQALAEGNADAAMGGGLQAAVENITTRFAPLVLDVPEAPVATICVGAGAPMDTIYRCLAALHAAGADAQADIVLLDDGSAGGEAALLPAVVRNLRYRRVPANASAVAARNEVAIGARGALVAFLAPQVQVLPGWLEEIAATFAREPDAAAVGAKVVRDDGLLHHTGILLGADGTLRDPGWLAAADDPEHDFLRAVHGLGDAAFALRRDMLAAAGGFNAGFASPAHAAFDLCMRLRSRGKQVLTQPLAVALWSDAGAPGPAPVPDLSLQDEDSRRLRQRWVDLAPSAPVAGQRGPGFIGHALVIGSDAGSSTPLEQMLLLRRLGYRVTFLAADGTAGTAEDIDLLRRNGIEAVRPSGPEAVADYLEASGGDLDLVQIYRPGNAARLLERVRQLAPLAKVVFSPVELAHLGEAERTARPAPGNTETHRQELWCIRHCDATILANSHEAELLAAEVEPARLHLVRWIIPASPPAQGFAGRGGACFAGDLRHAANAEAIQWFAAEVLPLIRNELADFRLTVAGGDVPEALRTLAGGNLVLLGPAADLAGLFDSVRLALAPLRQGGGLPGELLAGPAYGVPLVATTAALEGSGLLPGDGVAVADDAESFAREVVRLHGDEAAWTALAAAGLQRCRELYSPEAALEAYRRLLAGLELPVPAG